MCPHSCKFLSVFNKCNQNYDTLQSYYQSKLNQDQGTDATFRCIYTDCLFQQRDAMNAFTLQLQLHK